MRSLGKRVRANTLRGFESLPLRQYKFKMNGEQARSYFLSLPESLEDFPFGPETPILK